MSEDLQRGFRLGEHIVRPDEGCIECPDGYRHVAPKAMAVLLCLAARAGELVERREIITELWEGGHRADLSLTRAISQLRRALDDHHEHSRIIRTIPRRGYQLVAPVAPVDTVDHYDNGPEQNGSSGEFPSGLVQLLVSLRRRRVFRAMGGYAIGAWLMLQVADVLVPELPLPEWTMTALIIVIGFGFPIAVLLAWKLQLTDSGIVVDHGIQGAGYTDTGIHLHIVDYVMIGILLLIASVALSQFAPDRDSIESNPVVRSVLQLPMADGVAVHPKSLAVLSFSSGGDDPRNEVLGTALTSDLRREFSGLRALRVASAEASRDLDASDQEMAAIARRVMVRYILSGEVEVQADALRVQASLTDAASGLQLFSETYPRRPTDMLSMRGDIIRRVLRSVTFGSLGPPRQRIVPSPTTSGEAYLEYLGGLAGLEEPESDDSLNRAAAHFERAVELDPQYAEAYLGLCESRLMQVDRFSRAGPFSGIEEACNEALRLDPYLSRAHIALAMLHELTGNLALAEADFQRAIVLNPQNEAAFRGLAELYRSEERWHEAEIMFEACVELQPADWRTYLGLGSFYLEAGRPEKAIDPLRRVTELKSDLTEGWTALGAAFFASGDSDPAERAFRESERLSVDTSAYRRLGLMYYRTSRFEEAAELFRRAVDLTPDDYSLWGHLGSAIRFLPDRAGEARRIFSTAARLAGDSLEASPGDVTTLSNIATYYVQLGEVEKALATIGRARRYGPDDPFAHYCAARINALLGRLTQALDALENATDLGYPTEKIASDPDFTLLREEPRFLALVE